MIMDVNYCQSVSAASVQGLQPNQLPSSCEVDSECQCVLSFGKDVRMLKEFLLTSPGKKKYLSKSLMSDTQIYMKEISKVAACSLHVRTHILDR